MKTNKIYEGNNLDILKTFEDNTIDCCITSPPYYALRDYGTGAWIGGDPNCDHVANPRATKVFGNEEFNKNCPAREQTKTAGYYKTVCPKCGAVREDYQVGLEDTPEAYIDRLVDIFHEIRRCMKPEGTLWVNIGDTYYGSGGGRGTDYHDGRTDVIQSCNKGFNDMINVPKMNEKRDDLKPKDLIGIPWMLAFALRKDGWYLRQDIIWSKPNPMPESVKDRCTKSHEYIFLLSKSQQYYFNHDAIQEDATSDPGRYKYPIMNNPKEQDGVIRPGSNHPNTGGVKEWTGKRNKRDVWTINTSSYKGAHFATFSEELVYPMIMAGCPKGGVVLDPFMGSGTVAVVAKRNKFQYVGCELNPEYVKMANNRIKYTKVKLF